MSTPTSPVTMYTTTWCSYCVRLKKVMQREGIDFAEVNIEVDESAAELVMNANGGNRTVPTLVFADGMTSQGGDLRIWETPHEERARAALRDLLELPFEHVIGMHRISVYQRSAYAALHTIAGQLGHERCRLRGRTELSALRVPTGELRH